VSGFAVQDIPALVMDYAFTPRRVFVHCGAWAEVAIVVPSERMIPVRRCRYHAQLVDKKADRFGRSVLHSEFPSGEIKCDVVSFFLL
jgi:hypothetical protein